MFTHSLLPLYLLNIFFELADLLEQARLVLLLQISVLLHLDSDLHDFLLEILAGGLAVAHELLVLCDILLEVVEDLKLLVESNKRVELVLQLDLLLLEGKLKLVVGALVEHGLREALRGGVGGHGLGLGHGLLGARGWSLW